VVAIVRHLGGPVLDDEELVSEPPLVHEVLPGPDVHLVGPPGDLLALTVGQVREQWDRLQPRDVHVLSLSV
jgi:hypothetical protein